MKNLDVRITWDDTRDAMADALCVEDIQDALDSVFRKTKMCIVVSALQGEKRWSWDDAREVLREQMSSKKDDTLRDWLDETLLALGWKKPKEEGK